MPKFWIQKAGAAYLPTYLPTQLHTYLLTGLVTLHNLSFFSFLFFPSSSFVINLNWKRVLPIGVKEIPRYVNG
jgi:hypothetical protein